MPIWVVSKRSTREIQELTRLGGGRAHVRTQICLAPAPLLLTSTLYTVRIFLLYLTNISVLTLYQELFRTLQILTFLVLIKTS